MRTITTAAVVVIMSATASAVLSAGQTLRQPDPSPASLPGRAPAQQASDGPTYSASGELLTPQNYREWVFLSSSLDTTYAAEPSPPDRVFFENVFVTRDAYRAFKATGQWPEQAMFVLEGRTADVNASINRNGARTQSGRVFLEASVKDSRRYAATGGWAYFNLRNGTAESAKPNPPTTNCYQCHAANTAVDNTFVQFYPELLPVATEKGTIKAGYGGSR